MDEPRQIDNSERADRPGKTRTWWHPLLARLLDHELATTYSVREEVLVGKLPLRVDILLIRRETGELSEASRPVSVRRKGRKNRVVEPGCARWSAMLGGVPRRRADGGRDGWFAVVGEVPWRRRREANGSERGHPALLEITRFAGLTDVH